MKQITGTKTTKAPDYEATASNGQAKIATKQAIVSPISGVAPPADKQFGQPNGNPRHNGAWKKEDTARYKLEQMLKLSDAELRAISDDIEAPLFERKLAKCIMGGKWKELEGMMNQVYGLPKQPVTAEVQEMRPLVDLTKRKKNGAENEPE